MFLLQHISVHKRMDLFCENTGNLLPLDGEVRYYGPVLSATESAYYFDKLLHTIQWQNDEVIMFGKRIVTSRKTGWYGTQPYNYTYSGIARKALPFTPELFALKKLAEEKTGAVYNSCLLNLYHHGGESMGWHSDDEDTIVPDSAIASISLGAERKFSFKHKHTGQTLSVQLQNGSLLLMAGQTQQHWLHKLPPTKKVLQPRINLTFRCMLPQ